MGKLAFLIFCTIAFLFVIGIDFAQQRGASAGAFGPGDYLDSVRNRFGLGETAASVPDSPEADPAQNVQPAATPAGTGAVKQAAAGETGGADLNQLEARSYVGPAQADSPAAEPEVTVNRPSKRTSGCGAGSFCGVTN